MRTYVPTAANAWQRATNLTPANGTGFQVSRSGRQRMPLSGDFYRIAMLTGNQTYRSRFPAQGLSP